MTSDSSQPMIFLSYARADKPQAKRLATTLQKCGFSVWWDILIDGGKHFATTIDAALEAADVMVVLWSRSSIQSDWVRDEAAYGRDRHRLVPVSVDGSQPPLGFRQIQVIDMSTWPGRTDAPQIVALTRAIAAVTGQPSPAPAARTASTTLTRRRALAFGVGAAGAVAGGGLIIWQSGWIGSTGAAPRSIAVLPFKNLSQDPSQAFVSDGLTEEIRSALSRNASLIVLAGTSSNTVRRDDGDGRSIARKLGVAYLLDGSVQREGDRVRVATNLTNGKTGFSEWSQRVERRFGDMFALQSEIANSVSDALSVQMAIRAPAPGGTRDARAYEAYLRGKSLYNLAKGEETDREARADFEVAIASDPKFALAHAALSRVLASLAASSARASELKPLYNESVEEAQRAIDLAPTLAQGQLALGYAKFAGFLDFRGARPSYDRAYRYGRGDADIVLLYALYCVRARRFAEGRDAINRALALDPLNARTHRAAGAIAYSSRNFDLAIEHFRHALALNPEMANANGLLAYSLIEKGRLDDARVAALAEKKAMFKFTALASLEHRAGNQAAAQDAFDRLIAEEGDAALYQQAEVMAQWGRADMAVALLEKAHSVGDSGLTALVTDPLLDPIARDPRFSRLVKDIGFS